MVIYRRGVHITKDDSDMNIGVRRNNMIDIFKHEDNWQEVKDKVAEVEPELASCMVKDCVYRGFCGEMFSCGYSKTEAFEKELKEYRREKEK